MTDESFVSWHFLQLLWTSQSAPHPFVEQEGERRIALLKA